ncbi:hypothetical protein IFM89_019210 [Coptis chinensis]|uniref:SAM-dependent MTase DRM-type domain-containing protein n=1 Tax=Coptis chinensis TaxID=261450 RepID=A0A835MIM9_9MAGN|nr:hypothetical protein IFM89_019210 [Coptis chinensis]
MFFSHFSSSAATHWESISSIYKVLGQILLGFGLHFFAVFTSFLASTSAGPSASSSLIDHFVGMGYPENMVTKAIQENGMNGHIVTLLNYSALNDSPSQSEPACVEHSSENENDTFDDILDFESCLAEKEDAVDMPDKEKKFLQLIEMDFQEEEASSAIDACDPDTLITDLIDFIYAARMAKRGDSPHPVPDYAETLPGYRGCPPTFKKREMLFDAEERQEKNLEIGSRRPKESKKIRKSVCIEEEDEDEVHIPKLMIGFGVPDEPRPLFQRKLSEAAIGPPYFYFENVACTPISHSLYEVEPEFVDSLHFCAAARKRGYVHNLPTCNRYPLEPIPSLTIHRALPLTRKWWPLWDHREKFNCFRTDVATAQRTHRIKDALELCNGDPPLNIQKDIISQCQKWNLVWTGKNKAAPLEPHEIEIIMGYPVNHTRGVTRTERYKSLGNSFQVRTLQPP